MCPIGGLVDIHAHLLPGIDDGPAALPDSLKMAQAAVQSGIETMALTPHLRSDFPEVHVEELAERCQQLRRELSLHEIPLRIVPAAEVSVLWALEASEQELKLATYDQRGTDILIETPRDALLLEQLLHSLHVSGMRVTLAHPERSRTLHRTPERLQALHDQGVLFQINAGALLARRGNPVRRFAEQLCREGLVDVLASDGHRGTSWRPVLDLAAGVRAAARLVGEERARWMASDAPAAIVEGAPLPPAPWIQEPPRRWWRRR